MATKAVATAPAVPSRGPAAIGAAAALLVLYLGAAYGWRQAALLAVGMGLGYALYHAAFGFTSAYRVMFSDRRTAGLRAQMVMLAVGSLLFFPTLAGGTLLGMPVEGNVSPVGTSLLVGAFVFGLGMQLGGGCASGTLYTVGGGNGRMLITLLFFIVGSVIGSAHFPWWQALPAMAPVTLASGATWWQGLALQLAVLLAIAAAAYGLERRRHGSVMPLAGAERDEPISRRLVRGPWPLLWGAVALALLNFAVLALSGSPWGITSAFALWGAKVAAALGVDVASWPYWAAESRRAALAAPVLADKTSVTDFGIVFGALLAAALAGRFRPTLRIPPASLAAAVVGGLLLGYGARLAYGCNIGAYFSGVISGSAHGWVWLLAALVGNALGVRLRPWFGLPVERTPRPAAG